LTKEKGQMNRQTMVYKTPHRSINTNPTKNYGWTQVLRK